MTKKEILYKHFPEFIDFDFDIMCKAMDEYGRQCFEAGIKAAVVSRTVGAFPFLIDDLWFDYLKELEDEN